MEMDLRKLVGIAFDCLYVTGYTDSPSLDIINTSSVVANIVDQSVEISKGLTGIVVDLIPLGSKYAPAPAEGRDPAGSRNVFVLSLEPQPYEAAPVGGEIITPSSSKLWEA